MIFIMKIRLQILLASLVVLGSTNKGWTEIVYVDLDGGRIPRDENGWPLQGTFFGDNWQLDVDQNDTFDLRFRNFGLPEALNVIPLGGAEVIAVPAFPGDPVDIALPLVSERAIGPNPSQLFDRAYWSKDKPNGSIMYACVDIGCSGGFWFEPRYLGFRLAKWDGYHYGWILFEPMGGFGGNFLGYAYETEANRPILAGAIPEPGGSWLAASGLLAGLLVRSWNRRQLR